ncbi:MAG: BrxA/BrxB family bacilliredoxin [Candidatus Omnitrophica bacterium]|nr:BrxA/BrxB family bacilliredoxin [Candidatus Omnitrophota bacterium]MCA9439195.1 BrxA/BrxB family bacilliredoxin [Candidatus Omnitrophota bacterium]
MGNFGAGPTYDPVAVQPMRDELNLVGIRDLLTKQEVDEAFGQEGTVLLIVNSVCGCAAGNARPGAMMALQNETIPDHLTTVFAGQEKEAVAQARSYLSDYPPSSPCIALLKDGKVLGILQRLDIENKSAVEVATILKSWFDQHCEKQGPSIPRDQFEKLIPYSGCGSSIPMAGGGMGIDMPKS